jgi:NAD-dependent DNA ligase
MVRRLEDIRGIGISKANELRKQGLTVQTASRLTEAELADYNGIGPGIAGQIKREVGGATASARNKAKMSNTQAPQSLRMTDVGDFRVDLENQDKVRSTHNARSQRSDKARRVDERNRAPITTDVEKWRESPDEFDFPGVDTPTSDPDLKEKDLPFVGSGDLSDSGKDEFDDIF